MLTKKAVLSAVLCLAACVAGYFGRPMIEAPQPMPEMQPLPQGVGLATVRTSRIEVVDGAGRLSFVLTAEGGNAFIIVNVPGQGAKKIDLSYIAKRFG
jgi:hypothetical protein